MTRTEQLIARHEGYSQFIYTDTVGMQTIGYGINLNVGLTEKAAHVLMAYRISTIREHLKYAFPSFNQLSGNRQDVLIDMAYNLGISGLLKFKKMLFAINDNNYSKAAEEMLDSTWSGQVGDRAKELAIMMEDG